MPVSSSIRDLREQQSESRGTGGAPDRGPVSLEREPRGPDAMGAGHCDVHRSHSLALLLVGTGDAGRGQRPLHPQQGPHSEGHLGGAVGRDDPVGTDRQEVPLDLRGVADHSTDEGRRCSRRSAEQRGELATGQRLGTPDRLAPAQQGEVDCAGGRSGILRGTIRGIRAHCPDASARASPGERGTTLPTCRCRSRTTPPSGTDIPPPWWASTDPSTGSAFPSSTPTPVSPEFWVTTRTVTGSSGPRASTPPSGATSATPRSWRPRTTPTRGRCGSPT